jgi:hypothetical protein
MITTGRTYDTGGQKIGETIDILIEKPGQVPATMISVGSFQPGAGADAERRGAGSPRAAST